MPDGARLVSIPMYDPAAANDIRLILATASPAEMEATFGGGRAHEAMTRGAAALVVQDDRREGFGRMLRTIIDADTPSVIHCSAGKDRTGIGAALLMKALGAHEDDIMADYLLTGSLGNIEHRMGLNAVKVREMLGGEIPDHVAAALAGVSPDFLHGAFNAIGQHAGGVDGYLREVLGADEAWRKKAEKLLIE